MTAPCHETPAAARNGVRGRPSVSPARGHRPYPGGVIQAGRRSGFALAAALAVAAAVVSSQGHVLLHRCVQVGGSWTGTALSLAVLRDTSSCPDGSLGLGVLPGGAIVVISVVLPVIAAWAAAAALGISLTALVVRAARLVAGLVGRWVRLPRRRAALPVADRALAVAVTPAAPPAARALLVARPHRAPPLPA